MSAQASPNHTAAAQADVFISYRRDGGEFFAHLLYDRLMARGYSVFLDVESLRSGPFNTALYEQIDACTDVLLILPPQALDRCANPNDWVRLELERAIIRRKNIVPLMMRDFVWPDQLPPSLVALPLLNGLHASSELFDGVVEALCERFLKSQPRDRSDYGGFEPTIEPVDLFAVHEVVQSFVDADLRFFSLNTYAQGIDWGNLGFGQEDLAFIGVDERLDRLLAARPDLRELCRSAALADYIAREWDFRRSIDLASTSDSRATFSFGGMTYQVMDVFEQPQVDGSLRRYIAAYTSSQDLLPAISLFEVSPAGELSLVDRHGQQFLEVITSYAVFCRLIEMLPVSFDGERRRRIAETAAHFTGARVDDALFPFELFRWPAEDRYGHCDGDIEQRRFLRRTWRHVNLTPSSTDYPLPTDDGDRHALDCVWVKLKDERVRCFLALTCAWDASSRKYHHDPCVHVVTIKRYDDPSVAGGTRDVIADSSELTLWSTMPRAVRERFALRLALYESEYDLVFAD